MNKTPRPRRSKSTTVLKRLPESKDVHEECRRMSQRLRIISEVMSLDVREEFRRTSQHLRLLVELAGVCERAEMAKPLRHGPELPKSKEDQRDETN